MRSLLEELRKRRFIEWMLAYVAGSVLVLEIVDSFGPRWGLSQSAARGIDVSLAIGFLIAVVLAWYHGPRGRQEPTGTELLILTLLLLLASLTLALVVDEPFLAPEEDGREDASAVIHGRSAGAYLASGSGRSWNQAPGRLRRASRGREARSGS